VVVLSHTAGVCSISQLGVVLTFGAGNGPDKDKDIIQVFTEASKDPQIKPKPEELCLTIFIVISVGCILGIHHGDVHAV